MRQESVNSVFYPHQNNTFDFKKFLLRMLRKWHWFAISIFISITVAWLYNHYASPEYTIHSSLTVNQYESGIKRLSLDEKTNNERNIDVLSQDHAGRLKSHILNLNTLKSLGWNVSWFQKTPLYGVDLYKREPYKVVLLTDKINLTQIPIFITQISDSEFRVDVESEIDSLKIPIKFSQKGKFDEPFENAYFGFILLKTDRQIKSKENLYFVINNLNKLAIEYQKKLKVITSEKKPDLMELILIESNSRRGVDFLNKLEQTYIEYGLSVKNLVAENTMKFIDSQLKSVTDSLSSSDNKFTNFRTRTQSVDLNQAGGIVMQKQQILESDKAVIKSRLAYLRSLKNDLNDSRQMKQVVVPSVFGITDQTLNNLVTKLSDLYSRREVLSFSVQEKAPSLIMLDKEIQLTNNLLAQNINTLLMATESDLNNLDQRYSGFSSQLSILPKTEQQLSNLKRSFDLNNELNNYLLKMRAESAITYASNQPDVTILDSASIETTKLTGPATMLNYLLAIIFGIFVPVSTIMINDYFRNTIQSKDEIQVSTRLPIAGMIIHNSGKNNLIVSENPRSRMAESFRLLRTNLKYILAGDGNKVIAVQSTISGEGKSFISSNLACILAMNNLKVLLVGLDMRKSSLDTVFKSPNKKGLSTYLSNQHSFEDIIETSSITNLSYIPSGPVPPNPAELLENGNFEKFISEAKSRFDYIVLDSPPVSVVADGIITGSLADVNLFVIRFRYSNREQINFINELDSKKTLPNLALVLNDGDKESFGNGGQYNYRNKGYYI